MLMVMLRLLGNTQDSEAWGYLIITTPFAGREFRIVPGERQYDIERLELLERVSRLLVRNSSYRIDWVGGLCGSG